MNPSRTLADRFRTQRTERIRVDGTEVLSVIELEAPAGSLIELVVERQHDRTEQGLALTSSVELTVVETSPDLGSSQAGTDLCMETMAIESIVVEVGEMDADDTGDAADDVPRVRLWNTWRVDESPQAWTGNAGIVREDETAPEGASQRMRLWCSDGLGNATFDDLVVLVTIGEADTPTPA